MTERVLGVGLVGCGVMGTLHGGNLSREVRGARLLAVADLRAEAAGARAGACGAEASYGGISALLSHPGIEAVVIATPGETHGPLIEEAAAAGKHIFCEKPLEWDLAGADRALAAVRQAGVKLQVGFHRRFDPTFARVQREFAGGSIGRALSLQITSRDPVLLRGKRQRPPGDLYMETTVHDLDMARFLLGEVAEVYSAGGVMGSREGVFDDPDTALTLLRMAGGALVAIDNNRLSAHGYDQRLELTGTGGMLRAENERLDHAERHDGAGKHVQPPQPDFAVRYRTAYLVELQAFVDCVLGDRPPSVTREDGRAALVLSLAALQSYREGRVVSVGAAHDRA